MQVWSIITAWFLNVLVISFLLAVFEILIEKRNGWAAGLNPNTWGKKLFEGSVLARICEKPYFTVYHIFMFLMVLPAILIAEYLVTKSLGIAHTVYSPVLGTPHHSLVLQIGDVRLMPTFYMVSVWFAVNVVEDFFWFVMNWYYPNSLRELLSGKIWWHKRWISLGSIKLPRLYVLSLVLAAISLSASLYLVK